MRLGTTLALCLGLYAPATNAVAQTADAAPISAVPPKPDEAPAKPVPVTAQPNLIDPQAVSDPIVKSVYARSGWHTLWSAETIAAFDQVLAERNRHGLDRIEFKPAIPVDMAPAAADVERTRAALAYAGALMHGRVDPASLYKAYTLPGSTVDLGSGLAKALASGDLARWFAQLPPQDDEYRLLSDAYLVFSRKAGSGDAGAEAEASTPEGIIRVGRRDPRVPAIVEQLVESGYLLMALPAGSDTDSGSDAATAPVFTQAMADALKGLQRDYGIAADGAVGPQTLKVLYSAAIDRARALAVGLERRRWLARTPPATRIDVNTAEARLRYYRDNTLADERKVIVGLPGHETPPLGSPIFRLVANPTWTVPKSIHNSEMANADEAYLQAHNMVLRDGWIVQQPGPDNALGMVKFDMANDQAIYLHDTSAPELFDRRERHLSHGCVRVDDALGFAQMLAEDEGIGEQWQTAQASGETALVPLPTRIPVRLLYHTAYAGDQGKVVFRTDAYGWNDPIAEKLGFTKALANRADAKTTDIGP